MLNNKKISTFVTPSSPSLSSSPFPSILFLLVSIARSPFSLWSESVAFRQKQRNRGTEIGGLGKISTFVLSLLAPVSLYILSVLALQT